MGFCFSKPRVDDDDDGHRNHERAALLDDGASDSESARMPLEHDRFANMSAEEAARLREEERLKRLEQNTTDALINIASDRADFVHTQAFGGGGSNGSNGGGRSRDYVDILRRFNQQIKMPLTVLAGPLEAAARADVVAILSDPHVPPASVRLLDDTITRIIDITTAQYIAPPPGDCIVPLSLSIDAPR
ncbi:hypothetical protein GGI11_005683 [Coemansia sp. RSA 2049]|nr:hypothetical protein GGI11_005683 [Coemansia sp. RSA 2049]